MATWQDAIKALEGMENGADLVSAVRTALNKANNEAKGLRTRAKTLAETLGVDMDAEDYDDQLTGIKSSLEAMKSSGAKPDEVGKKLAELEKQLKAMTTESEANRKAAEEATAKRAASVRRSALVEALTKAGAVKPAELAKLLEDRVKVLDNDSVVYLDGETEIDVVAGATKYLEANPEFRANRGQPGAGSAPGGTGGAPDLEKMSDGDYVVQRLKQLNGG